MRILHILSQLQPTGAEFYAVTVAEEQRRRGDKVIVVSDNLFVQTDIEFIQQPIGDRSYWRRFQNIGFIRKLVVERNIDIVHCHSRAASWVAHYALKKFLVPLVSTVHGRQHVHRSSRGKNIYGQKIISVCREINNHLISELNISEELTTVIPNCIEKPVVSTVLIEKTDLINIAVAGRTTGPKGRACGQIIEEILPKLLESNDRIRFVLIGGDVEQLPESSQKTFDFLSKKYGERVVSAGFVRDLGEHILQMDLVIASGRTAVESLLLNVPTIAIGEACCEGLVDFNNLERCLLSNFGDISGNGKYLGRIDEKLGDLIESTIYSTKKGNEPEITARLREYYSVEKVVSLISKAYFSARARKGHPKHIPNLMYHKIPTKKIKTKHKTYLTASNFEKHLRFLKFFKFTPITFKQYFEFWVGDRRWEDFPSKPIFLTFDDGYKDNFENVLPLITKYKVPIVLFPLADGSIKNNYWDLGISGESEQPLMNWSQIRGFVEQGSEIGSHGLRHLDFVMLESTGERERLKKEMVDSKKIIEMETGATPITLAYPFGNSTAGVRELAKEVGYIFGVSTDSGGLNIEDDFYHIFRVNIFPTDGYLALLKKCSSSYRKRFFKTRGR